MRASISAALDRELSEPESIRVREHVAHCPSCRAFQADTKRFVSTLRAAPLEPKAPGDRSACHLPLSRDQVDKIAAVGKKAAGLEGPSRDPSRREGLAVRGRLHWVEDYTNSRQEVIR
jgi:hypothetical protein